MKLEEGKKYLTRLGDTVGPLEIRFHHEGSEWYQDGHNNGYSDLDIVSEYNAPEVNKKSIIEFFKTKDRELVRVFFVWSETPQGSDYWKELWEGKREMKDGDYVYLSSLL